MFLLILIIIIILSKKQDLNIFKYYNSKYICNTFLEIGAMDYSYQKLSSILKKRISNISYLQNNENTIDNFLYIEKYNDLLKQLNTQKSIVWRFIIYKENQNTMIIFQNHRSLCGGQERIWKIINYILDDPVISIKKHNKFNILDTLSIDNYFYFLTNNTLLKLPLIFNSNNYKLNKTKYFTIKKFNLLLIKRFCLKYNCSINDFAISYTVYFLVKSKKFLNKYINVFIPVYLQTYYTYYILRIPNNFLTFYELLYYIKIMTKKTLKNPIIKYNTYLNTKLVQILPNAIYLKMYEKILSKIDIFISNVHGFSNHRTLFGFPVKNIYQVYNSYNCAIESGISSYANSLIISMNINEKFK